MKRTSSRRRRCAPSRASAVACMAPEVALAELQPPGGDLLVCDRPLGMCALVPFAAFLEDAFSVRSSLASARSSRKVSGPSCLVLSRPGHPDRAPRSLHGPIFRALLSLTLLLRSILSIRMRCFSPNSALLRWPKSFRHCSMTAGFWKLFASRLRGSRHEARHYPDFGWQHESVLIFICILKMRRRSSRSSPKYSLQYSRCRRSRDVPGCLCDIIFKRRPRSVTCRNMAMCTRLSWRAPVFVR